MLFLLRRRILVPWLLSSVVMYGLSYVWHGIALTDLQELTVPLTLYLLLAAMVYLALGLGMTLIMHYALSYELISMREAFPFKAMALGGAVGFLVYLVVFILGISFAAHNAMHIVVDVLWQMLEQSIGGLMVSFGIIYDLHRTHLEVEGSK